MNNEVTLVGRVSSDMEFDHEACGEKFFRFTVDVTRESRTVDKIPVMISEHLIGAEYFGHVVGIHGQYRSHNLRENQKTIVKLYVLACDVKIVDYTVNVNDVFLEGYVCKKPVLRRTPSGKDIADLILSVPRISGKSDYIPCIIWGESAKYVGGMEAGSNLRVAGRVQSREYVKDEISKTAYEISVNLVEELNKVAI